MAHGGLIRFVSAASDRETEEVYSNQQHNTNNGLSGEEAKSFYETIVNDELSNHNVAKHSTSNGYHLSRKHCVEPHKSQSDSLSREPSDGRTNATNCDSSPLTCNEEPVIKVEHCDAHSSYTDCDYNWQESEPSTSVVKDENYIRKHNQILRLAQNGDKDDLEKLFRTDFNIDVDYQDQYGWTALMCAAVARQIHVVRLLLSNGANKFILNHKDKTVLELCEEVGAIDVKIIINTYHDRLKEEATEVIYDSFYCDICKLKFSESTFKQHSTSTAHLFNLKLKPKSDQFMIPENNRGFQLMRKSGWDGEKGLGPEGHGNKYPVKTVLKRDRKCLGTGDKKKTKVTHFGPNDKNAVKSVHPRNERIMSVKAISKRERKRKEQKARLWERNLRTYMNIDFP